MRALYLLKNLLEESRCKFLVCELISDCVRMELINSYEDESETSEEGLRYVEICRNDSFLML